MARKKSNRAIAVNDYEIEQLAKSDPLKAIIAKAALAIAGDARAMAPRGVGRHGADSITYEMVTDDRGLPEAHVSYGKRFGFHMQFKEFGTSKEPAQPFLRPSANKRRSL